MSKASKPIVFFGLFVSILLFQNCGPQSSLEMQNDSSGGGFTYMSDINSLSPRPVQPIAPLPPPPDVFATSCEVHNYRQWQDCLAKAKSPQGQDGLAIYIRNNIILAPGERLSIVNHQNLQIIGALASNGKAAVIRESAARAASNAVVDAHLLVLGEGNRNITIKELIFEDTTDSTIRSDYRRACKLGGHGRNQFRPQRCQAPVVLGSGDKTKLSQQIYFLRNKITSDKAYLMQVVNLENYEISHNKFHRGSYIGVSFAGLGTRINGKMEYNEFQSAGTAGLSLSNASKLTLYRNTFFNNYRDPQFKYQSGGFHKGGQLEVIDPAGSVLSDVTIDLNTFSTNSQVAARSSSAIEVRGSSTGLIDILKIVNNIIENIPLAAIQFRRNAPSHHKNIVITGNTIRNAYADYADNVRPRLGASISLGALHLNSAGKKINWQGLDLGSNRITAKPGTRSLAMAFTNTIKTCSLRSTQSTCDVNVSFTAENIFSDTVVVIKRNGTVVHRFARGQNQGSFAVPSISRSGAVISLHESEADNAPLAAFHAHAID